MCVCLSLYVVKATTKSVVSRIEIEEKQNKNCLTDFRGSRSQIKVSVPIRMQANAVHSWPLDHSSLAPNRALGSFTCHYTTASDDIIVRNWQGMHSFRDFGFVFFVDLRQQFIFRFIVFLCGVSRLVIRGVFSVADICLEIQCVHTFPRPTSTGARVCVCIGSRLTSGSGSDSVTLARLCL